jgi:hypothetical protein
MKAGGTPALQRMNEAPSALIFLVVAKLSPNHASAKLEVISSTNNTLQVVTLENGEKSTYSGAYEVSGNRVGDLTAQGDTNVQTLVNGRSGTKKIPASDASRVTDQDIDGATDAQNNGYAFTDVSQILGTSFTGNLTLNAILTQEVVGKYLNLKDQVPALAGADNTSTLPALPFNYSLGSGNDTFDLAISAANLAAAGTATREDFVLTINGGSGNDVLSTAIYDGKVTETNPGILARGILGGADTPAGREAWYENSKLNANLSIDAGAGNDVVNTFGSGDWKIDLGAGNDTYYADNTGEQDAAWVFNTLDQSAAADRNLANLRSDAAFASYSTGTATITKGYLIGGLKVQVSFKDLKSNTLATKGAFESVWVDVPAKDGIWVTDLEINQAIKKAINDDSVLSKLLVATDGPANTLVVTAKSDGQHLETDLAVSFAAAANTALSTANSAAILAALKAIDPSIAAIGTSQVDALAAITGGANTLYTTVSNSGVPDQVNAASTNAQYDAKFGTQGAGNTEVDGIHSLHTSDNTIQAGTGDDVIVLSTGLDSNDTIVWTGYNNGFDTIVNFAPVDVAAGEYFGEVFTVGLNAVTISGGASGDTVTVAYTGTPGGLLGLTTATIDTSSNNVDTIGGLVAGLLDTANAATGWDISYDSTAHQLVFTQTDQSATDPSVTAVTFTYGTAAATGTPVFQNEAQAVLVDGVGHDVLDLSSYGAIQIDVGNYDANGFTSLGSTLSDGSISGTYGANEAARKYISLEHLAGDESGVYEIKLWEDTNKHGDAEYDNAGSGDKLVGLIGTVDLGLDLTDVTAATGIVLI